MPSHFSTIGFSVSNQSEFESLAIKAAENGRAIAVNAGTYIQWREKNGAELWVQLNTNQEIVGVNPHYAGKASMRVGLVKEIPRPKNSPLDGAFYGWADPMDENPNKGVYPFVFDSPNFLIKLAQLPTINNVQISAFAHEIQVYSNEEKFYEANTQFASQSFIPAGLFTPKLETVDPPKAHAIFTGRVIQYATLINEFTGIKYKWALVQTLGGEVDVVVDASLVHDEVNIGSIISGSFWLSGNVIQSP